jgi:hypothetical protein
MNHRYYKNIRSGEQPHLSHASSFRLVGNRYPIWVCQSCPSSPRAAPLLRYPIAVGLDRMQRNFEPMRKQVEVWQRSELTDVTAKVVIYEAFVEGKLGAPKHLARTVHELYFLCGAEIYVALASGMRLRTRCLA